MPVEQQVDQPHEHLLVAGRAADDVGQAAEDVDPLVGLAEGLAAELFEREGPLAGRPRQIERDVDPLIDQRERRLADDKMLAGPQAELSALCPRKKTGLRASGSSVTCSRPSCQTISTCRREIRSSQGVDQAPPAGRGPAASRLRAFAASAVRAAVLGR